MRVEEVIDSVLYSKAPMHLTCSISSKILFRETMVTTIWGTRIVLARKVSMTRTILSSEGEYA